MKCIFCKKENNSPSIEHIIPQSISCPEGLVLKDGEVCKECNSYLGLELDSILKNYLEPWMLALGVYSINQKELKVNSFRNFVFETRNDKNPIIRVNMDRAEQSLGGGIVKVYKHGRRNVRGELIFKNNETVKIKMIFENNNINKRKLIRSLYMVDSGELKRRRGWKKVTKIPWDMSREQSKIKELIVYS